MKPSKPGGRYVMKHVNPKAVMKPKPKMPVIKTVRPKPRKGM